MDEDERAEHAARKAVPIKIPLYRQLAFSPNNAIQGQGWDTMKLLHDGLSLDMSAISKFYSYFCMADKDKGGTIDIDEFYSFFRLERSPFNDRIFRLFDQDKSDEIDFEEFVCSIWNLCTWPQDSLPVLMFNLYDEDSSGYLGLEETKQMIRDVFQTRKVKFMQEILIQSLQKISVPGVYESDWRVYAEHFLEWSGEHPELWHPLKCMQLLIRNKIFGKHWWEKIGETNRRRLMEDLGEIERQVLGDTGARKTVQLIRQKRQETEESLHREKTRAKIRVTATGGNVDSHADSDDETDSHLRNDATSNPSDSVLESGLEGAGIDAERRLREAKRKVERSMNRNVKQAHTRIEAIKTMRSERQRYFKDWQQRNKKLNGNANPVTQMLKFQDRDLVKSMFMEFDNEWQQAKHEVLEETYDRKSKLGQFEGKMPKDQILFQRKSARQVSSNHRFTEYDPKVISVANGKQRREEQVDRVRLEQRKSIRLAKNSHLARTSDSDESSDSSDDDGAKYRVDACAQRKSFRGQYGDAQNHKKVPESQKQARMARARSLRNTLMEMNPNLGLSRTQKSISFRSTRRLTSGRNLARGRSTHKVHDTPLTASELLCS